MRTVTALFDTYDHAAAAVRAVKDAGIPSADISLIANTTATAIDESVDAEEGAAAGAGVGAVAGGGAGLLAGLGTIAIPGIGPVIAGGWLLATAAGAAAGAILGGAAGGIIGALVAGGVPESDAHVYSEAIRRGGSLVTAKVTPEQIDQAKAILDDNDAIDVGERRAAYEAEGWTGFDENAKPKTSPGGPTNDSILPPFL